MLSVEDSQPVDLVMNPPSTEFDAQFTCSKRLQNNKIIIIYIYIVYILYINTFSDELFIMVETINFFTSLSDCDKYIKVEELYSNNKNINLANSNVLKMIGYSV